MVIPFCRACGVGLSTDDDWEALETYLEIYSQLTSIKLDDDNKELCELKVCSSCIHKLQDFDQFRNICLQVHWRLLNVKTEKSEDAVEDQVATQVVKCEPQDLNELLKSDSSGISDNDNDNAEDDDDEEDNKPLLALVECDVGGSDESDDENKKEVKPKKPRAKYGSKKSKEPKERVPIYNCDQCPRTFRVIRRLNAHKRTHAGLKPFECELCGKDFEKWHNLKVHHIQKHTDNKIQIPCESPGCGQAFATRQGLKRHWRKVHDPDYVEPELIVFVCDTCGKTFTTNGALKKHKFIHAPNEMPFGCGTCGKKFPTSHKLKEHTMRHEGIKNHTCSYCGMRKTTMHELKTHINNVHNHVKGRTYPCELCSSVFSNSGNLNRHVKIVHLGLKPYVCLVCGHAFGKSDHLKRHMKSHNLSTASTAVTTAQVPSADCEEEEPETNFTFEKMEPAVEADSAH